MGKHLPPNWREFFVTPEQGRAATLAERWLVHHLILLHGFTSWVGDSKGGKSTLFSYLVRAILRDEKFGGTLPVIPGGPVVWVTEETREEFSTTVASAGLTYDESGLYVLSSDMHKECAWEKTVAAAGAMALDLKTKTNEPLVIFDTMTALMHFKNENDNAEWIEKCLPVRDLLTKGVTVLGSHHPKKPFLDRKTGKPVPEGEVVDSGRGGSSLRGQSSANVRFAYGEKGRSSPVRVIQIEGRFHVDDDVPAKRAMVWNRHERTYLFLDKHIEAEKRSASRPDPIEAALRRLLDSPGVTYKLNELLPESERRHHDGVIRTRHRKLKEEVSKKAHTLTTDGHGPNARWWAVPNATNTGEFIQ